MKTYALFATLVMSLSAAASQLPFIETFEPPAVTNGTVNGQNEWVSLSGTNSIQSTMAANGSQALEIRSGAVTHALSNSSTAVWLSFHTMISETPGADPVLTNANTSVAFFVNTNRNLVVYNSTNQFKLTNVQIETNTWVRFDVYCDYSSRKWILSVNGTTVAENLGLYSEGSQIESLLIASESAAPVYFDELAVQNTEPTNGVANIDKDTDGIPDWWEQRYFGGVTNALPGGTGINGLTHLQTYIAGLNPDDANDLLKLAQTNRRKFNWDRKPGRQYDIYWTSNLTTSFTYIQTAIGNEFEDTSTERTERPAGFYQIRVHP